MRFAGTLVFILAGCQVVFPLDGAKDAAVDSSVDGPQIPANLVFITGSQFTGQLGGLAGADAKCNAAAMSMGLPPVFVAWLSASRAGRSRYAPTPPTLTARPRTRVASPCSSLLRYISHRHRRVRRAGP